MRTSEGSQMAMAQTLRLPPMQSAHCVQASAAGCRQAGRCPADAAYVAGSPLQSQEEHRLALRSARRAPSAPARGRPQPRRRADAAVRAPLTGRRARSSTQRRSTGTCRRPTTRMWAATRAAAS